MGSSRNRTQLWLSCPMIAHSRQPKAHNSGLREYHLHVMSGTGSQRVTELLADGRLSDAERANELLPLVYEQLRQVARHVLAGERPDHTLQPTALVHEAYLRLIGDREVPWTGRAHFYAAAAESMRRILFDHARFYAGLSHEQTAKAMGISKATVERRWAFARTWLNRALDSDVI
jgi:hypothetical protein